MSYYYVVNEETQEITGPIELPITPGIGVQVPGNAIELTELLPIVDPGYVWVWRNGQILQIIDLRSQLVYRKDNGNPLYWSELGAIPDYLTVKPRPDTYYFWKDDDWVPDVDTQHAALVTQAGLERDNRLREVVIRIAPLQYAYELGEASSDQLATLQTWKRYALTLARIELQPDYPLVIEWPATPAELVASPIS